MASASSNKTIFHILIDTSVWLDLGQDHQKKALLDALEELLAKGRISILLPELVVAEFHRNKARILSASAESLSSNLKRAKDAVTRFGKRDEAPLVLKHLNDVDQRLPILAEAAAEGIARVEALFQRVRTIPTTDAVKLRAAQRGIEKQAPFHTGRNSMGDSILIEIYADAIREIRGRRHRFAFVTHNFKDFSSQGGNQKSPHQDISEMFSKLRSLYFISLKETLERIEPALVKDLTSIFEGFEPRRLSEIGEAAERFEKMVWYNRHHSFREEVATGKVRIVDKYPEKGYHPELVSREIWLGALRSAAKVEQEIGITYLGPWDDFEWGMINGKLSTLRWMMGFDWDMLDT